MNETSFFCYRLQQFGECCGSQCGACQDKDDRVNAAESKLARMEADVARYRMAKSLMDVTRNDGCPRCISLDFRTDTVAADFGTDSEFIDAAMTAAPLAKLEKEK